MPDNLNPHQDPNEPLAPQRLRDLQTRFLRDVFDRERSLEVDTGSSGRLSSDRQMAAYRGSVWGNLCRAMGEIFPVTVQLVGERYFDAMARRYLERHPPTTPYLHDLGADFECFARQFEPLRELPVVVDMVGLEWRWHEAFHAEDSRPWSASTLAELSPEQQMAVRFQLQPGLSLMESAFSLDEIWQAHQPGQSVGGLSLAAGTQTGFVIYREAHAVVIEPLAPALFQLLKNIQQGAELAANLAVLSLNFPEDEPGELLGQVLSRPWVANLMVGPCDQDEKGG